MKSSAPSRLPRAPSSSRATIDPIADKENAFGPPEKKRKLSSIDTGPPTRRTTIGGLSARKDVGNGRPPVAPPAQTAAEPQWEGISSESMNVEELLAMKMMGKGKFDYKGKSEQMMDYIKKLRGCIRNFQQLEQGFIMDKEGLEADVAKERLMREEAAAAATRRQDDSDAEVASLKQTISELERQLSESQANNVTLQAQRQSDAEALAEGAETKVRLTADLTRAQAEIATLTEQGAAMRDINTRLQEYNTSLQSYNSKLQGDAATAQQAVLKVQEERSALVEELAGVKGQNAALQAQLEQALRSADDAVQARQLLSADCERARAELAKTTAERDEKAAEGKALATENARYRECTGKSAAEMELLANKATALEESFSSQAELIAGLRRQIEVGAHKIQLAEGLADQRRGDADSLYRKCTDLEAQLAEAEKKVTEGEEVRRKLHNTIQELKGNIRVFCRVRPPTPEEEKENGAEPPLLQYSTSAELAGRGIELVPSAGPKYPFAFDKVFGPEAPQAEVFQEISMLVQSALDGYKVCIFAYGQTGSGKTHTMLGVSQPADARGMIPRSLEQIFQASQHLETQGWKFTMQASMLEIYNETLRDLLGPSSAQKEKAGDANAGKQHTIKHDAQGTTTVADLTLVEVATWKEVELMMQKAAQSRTVGRTAMNERSSRSHCVFTLRIAGSNESTEQQVHGVLNLIDLAGSERLSRSGATGDRLKETQAINKSLSCLGDVISAIANRDAHVPYRNSKLTYLLQPCLGGDSKTLMFVNIAPDRSSFNESLCSLRFAAKVNACEIGVPRRQAKVKDATGQ